MPRGLFPLVGLVLGLVVASAPPLRAQSAAELPSCDAECRARRERLVIEDSPQGGWAVKPGEERRYRDVENELGRLAEELEPFTADASIAAVEITFPRIADPAIEAQLHAIVADAGFDLRGPVSELRGFGEDRVVALYLREPRRILTLAIDDERVVEARAALWQHDALTVWVHTDDALELWTANAHAEHCASILATRTELEVELPAFDTPTCDGDARTSPYSTHRQVVLSGPREAEMFAALRVETSRPTAPWILEVLCDENTLDAVIDTATAPVFALGAWRDRGFSYGWLGLPTPVASSHSSKLYTLLFTVAHDSVEIQDRLELWKAEIPIASEFGDLGHVLLVPRYVTGRKFAQDAGDGEEPLLELGARVPPLYAQTLSGGVLDLAAVAPHRTLLLHANDVLKWGDALMDLVEGPLLDCIERGEPTRLVLVPTPYEETAWSRRIGPALEEYTDIVLRACWDWGLVDDGWSELFDSRSFPAMTAVLIDGQRRVGAIVEGEGVFEHFAARLQEALNVVAPCTVVASVPDTPAGPIDEATNDAVVPMRLERIAVMEEWVAGRPSRLWDEQMDEIVEEVRQRALAAKDEAACVGVELAFPGEMDEWACSRIDDVLLREGFVQVGSARLIEDDYTDHYQSAHYLRDPHALFLLDPRDARMPAITGALWEARVPFVWRERESGFELVCPARATPWAQTVLAHSPLLAGMDTADLDLPNELSPPPRYQEPSAHRVALVEGPAEAAAFERLRALGERPSAPWAIEILADSATWVRSLDSASRPIRLRGKDVKYRYTFDRLGGVEEQKLCPTRAFHRIVLGVAPVEVTRLSHSSRTSPVTLRLWELGHPVGWEFGMGCYPYVAGSHLAECSRALRKAPSVLRVEDVAEQLEIGSAAPRLLGTLSDGGSADLSRFEGRPVLLLFALPNMLGNLSVLELRRQYRKAIQLGNAPVLIVDPSLIEEGNALEMLPDLAQHVLVLEQDIEQWERAQLEFGLMHDSQHFPAGFLIDAEGRIAARIGANGIYWSFRDELRAALGLK